MLDATVDSNGYVRVVPGSLARFTVSASKRSGWITITSRDDRILVLNGDGVMCRGMETFHLHPGKSFDFLPAEAMADRQ